MFVAAFVEELEERGVLEHATTINGRVHHPGVLDYLPGGTLEGVVLVRVDIEKQTIRTRAERTFQREMHVHLPSRRDDARPRRKDVPRIHDGDIERLIEVENR